MAGSKRRGEIGTDGRCESVPAGGTGMGLGSRTLEAETTLAKRPMSHARLNTWFWQSFLHLGGHAALSARQTWHASGDRVSCDSVGRFRDCAKRVWDDTTAAEQMVAKRATSRPPARRKKCFENMALSTWYRKTYNGGCRRVWRYGAGMEGGRSAYIELRLRLYSTSAFTSDHKTSFINVKFAGMVLMEHKVPSPSEYGFALFSHFSDMVDEIFVTYPP